MSIQGPQALKDSVKPLASRHITGTTGGLCSVMYSYLRDCCHLLHLSCHFLQTCFLIAALFLCHSLCCGHAVKECGTSFTETGFSSVRQLTPRPTPLPPPPPLHRHSSSSPLSMQTRHSWCFFLFVCFFCCCCEPRYSLIYDLAFSGFRWTSHHFPPKPDNHVGIWWGPQNAERVAIFFLPLTSIQTVKTPDILFISGNLTLLFSSPIPPFSSLPHPHSILNNIYI